MHTKNGLLFAAGWRAKQTGRVKRSVKKCAEVQAAATILGLSSRVRGGG